MNTDVNELMDARDPTHVMEYINSILGSGVLDSEAEEYIETLVKRGAKKVHEDYSKGGKLEDTAQRASDNYKAFAEALKKSSTSATSNLPWNMNLQFGQGLGFVRPTPRVKKSTVKKVLAGLCPLYPIC